MAEEEYAREVIGRRDGPAVALLDAARASAAVWAIETGTVSCKNGCRGRCAYSGKRARMAQAVSLCYQYHEPAAIHAHPRSSMQGSFRRRKRDSLPLLSQAIPLRVPARIHHPLHNKRFHAVPRRIIATLFARAKARIRERLRRAGQLRFAHVHLRTSQRVIDSEHEGE